MLVRHKGKKYEVGFEHERRNFVLPKSKNATSITEPRMVTVCTITRGKKTWAGESTCRPPDQFSREEGRKRALKRAAVELTGPRNQEMIASIKGAIIPAWTDLVGRLRARAGLPAAPSPYVRTFVPQKGVLELRRAIWDAYFARAPQTFTTKWIPVGGFTALQRLLPTDEELRQMAVAQDLE